MKKDSQSKKIYNRQTKEWIEVSEEYYHFHNKERDLYRDKMRSREECGSPQNMRWICDTECLTCEFKKRGRWQSLDAPIKEDESTTLGNLIPSDDPSIEEVILDSILLEELMKVLKELDSDASMICRYVMEGYSEREIAKLLNLPRSTYKRRWEKVKKELYIKLKDFL